MPEEKVVDNQVKSDYQGPTGKAELREKRRHDHWGSLFPGLALILAGVLLFSANRGWLSSDTWWQYLLLGLGIIFLIDAGVRFYSPGHREEARGRFIPGVILVCIGLAFIYGWDQWWPLVLVAAGIVILLNLYFRRNRSSQ